ncbi:MAG: PA0069 family radical SAM protein [Alphaproteobacteria bacterium]|nr:PA0069 family radical SAM protein [Alphaproteobacteria bacterium]
MDYELPSLPHHGRGAVSAPAGRFERLETSAVDDGWRQTGRAADDLDETPRLLTHLHTDTSRSVINHVDSPDIGFLRSINPYRGCEHGCIYCFARPSHSYLGFSAGLDFETEIFHKPDAPEILKRELAARGYKPYPIMLGSNTDCYQPVERDLKLTRAIIEILAEARHPVAIITKSALVARDIDILAPMAEQGLVRVNISVTTLDPTLARAMEPRAAAPYKRLETIAALAKAGIPVHVMTAPMIPGLNDMEMERIMQAAREAGAAGAHYNVVRLPYELKHLFEEWLRAHYPDRAERVLSLIRQTRGGKLYDAGFSQRMVGQGPYADLIAQRFDLALKRYGFPGDRTPLRMDLFRPPERDGQLALGF